MKKKNQEKKYFQDLMKTAQRALEHIETIFMRNYMSIFKKNQTFHK